MSLSAEQVNQEALGVATSVLNDSVVAAAHCEQVTQDQQLKAFGVGGATRGMAKVGRGMGRAMMPSVGNMAKGLESGGLPKTFILAVTGNQVHALEEKEKRGKLVAGKVLKSWNREGFRASVGTEAIQAVSGAPEDRRVLTLYLPLDDSKNKYLQASAEMMAAAGSAGMPTRFMIAKDEASDGIVKELVGDSPAMPNIQVGGVPVQMPPQMAPGQMPPQMAPAPATDSTAQLERLAQLHASGALTDEEFAAQKAKIIGS
jgi:hypothetical protein